MLKEKLKILKGNLKCWNQSCFGDLKEKIKDVVEKINEVDIQDKEGNASDEGLIGRKELISEFWKEATNYESLMQQKARSKWLKDGNGNPKFFHAMVNRRRRKNMLRGLLVDGRWENNPWLNKK